MNFLQRTPFFRLLLPFIIGIILFQYVELFQGSLYVMFGLSLFLILLSWLIRQPKRQFQFRWLFGCGIFLFMLSLAYFLSSKYEKENAFDHLQQKGIYRVELTASPVEKAKSYLCKVDVMEFYDSSWKPARGKAIIYLQKDPSASKLLFGDRMMVQAEFAEPDKAQNPNGFDYAAYLKRQGIGATCYISSDNWRLVGKSTSFSIRREADKWQKYLLSIYRKFNIQGDELAVLSALTLGYTDDLQPDIRASYSATGAMHILSVSGMHVGVVYIVIAFLLSFLNRKQWTKVFKGLFIIVFLWAYAFLSGMSAAVIRAAMMFSFVALASCFERKSQIYNTIFMSAFFMLIYNPNFLYDVGFQLSYSAVLSIIFFQPILNKLYLPKNLFSRFLWSTVSVSVAAQLGTMPFTLYYFQQFPNYFLLTNLVAILLSTIIIYVAIGLLLLSTIPYLSVWIGFALKWLLWALNHFIVWVENLPYSVSHISLDVRQTIMLFFALFCLSGYYYTKKFAPLFVGLVSLLVACLFNLQVNYNTLTSRRMIVYAGQKGTHVSFINGNHHTVVTTDSVEAEKIGKAFWQNQKLEKAIFQQQFDGFACFDGNKMLILKDDFLRKKTTSKPLALDYLVVGGGRKPRIDQILDCVHPKKIIVDKSISKWYTDNIRKACKSRGIAFYAVAERGAYVLNIKD
jgi:competence protein ComEC